MSNKGLKPGSTTPESGIYEKVGPRGGKTSEQATSTRGNPLPPTEKAGETWKLVEPAHHKSDR
jgi:hypothetical protein